MQSLEAKAPEISIASHTKSLLERLLEDVHRDSGLHLSFEDLTGVMLDTPTIKLPYHFRIHTCDFCLHAKKSPNSHQHCVRNKMAANRVALQRRKGYSGQCHLGLTELINPLVSSNLVIGIFYYGSFVLVGTEAMARKRIIKFCRRHCFDPSSYIQAFEDAPRVFPERLPELWRRLNLITDLTRVIVESIGIPAGRYRTFPGQQFTAWNSALPILIRSAITFISHHYTEPLRIEDIAAKHRCNTDYFSRIFKRAVGMKPSHYIQRVRIDHAQRLLLSNRFSIGEIGFMVGYQDHSHFGKVFRQLVGVTPQEYRHSEHVQDPPREAKDVSYVEYSNIRSFNPQLLDNAEAP